MILILRDFLATYDYWLHSLPSVRGNTTTSLLRTCWLPESVAHETAEAVRVGWWHAPNSYHSAWHVIGLQKNTHPNKE